MLVLTFRDIVMQLKPQNDVEKLILMRTQMEMQHRIFTQVCVLPVPQLPVVQKQFLLLTYSKDAEPNLYEHVHFWHMNSTLRVETMALTKLQCAVQRF